MYRRLALLGTTLALAVPVGLTAAPVASADSFPASVKRGYTKGCIKGAKREGATTKQARRFCRVSLRCLERSLTLEQFQELGEAIAAGDKTPPHAKKLKRCQQEGTDAL